MATVLTLTVKRRTTMDARKAKMEEQIMALRLHSQS